MNENDIKQFEIKLKQRFEESVSSLDGTTRSKITTVRNQVLDNSVHSGNQIPFWVPAGALGTICTAILIYTLVPREIPEDETFIDEIDIISELDLYENLDFYEWLDQHELPT